MTNVNHAKRRARFLKKAQKAVAVFPSAPTVARNANVTFPYRQESNFYYLTGFEEPESLCLLSNTKDKEFQLFVRPKDRKLEQWEGRRHGPKKAKQLFGADNADVSDPPEVFEEAFIEAMAEAETVYYRLGIQPDFDQKLFALLERAKKRLGRKGRPMWPIHDPAEILGEMRLFKEPSEIERMRKAGEIAAHAHRELMKIAKPGVYEYEIEGKFFEVCRAAGAKRLAYESIVASGDNACILHYVNNDRKAKKGDLMLVDAGAEFDYYAADITRTYPVSGKFTKEQKEIYSAVLEAQKEAIKLARPGKTLVDIHLRATEVLVEHLKRLKLLKGKTKQIIKTNAHKDFFPHGTSHWLGMDVHDAGKYYGSSYDQNRKLAPGMTFTIEPGLYFGDGVKCPKAYRGIGVRIEDDILITSKGCEVLTASVPKEIDEVSAMLAERV